MGHMEYQGWLGNQNQKYSAGGWFFAASKKKLFILKCDRTL